MSERTFIMVVSTYSSREEAERIVSLLLDEKLIACATIVDGVTSHFIWQGTRHVQNETLVLAKTEAFHYRAIEHLIKEHHSYDVPEIIAFQISHGSEEYISWLTQVVS